MDCDEQARTNSVLRAADVFLDVFLACNSESRRTRVEIKRDFMMIEDYKRERGEEEEECDISLFVMHQLLATQLRSKGSGRRLLP